MRLDDLLKTLTEKKYVDVDMSIGYMLTITTRPHYCDRGNFMVQAWGPDIDGADAFPRYYFDPKNMVHELILWADKRQLKIGLEL